MCGGNVGKECGGNECGGKVCGGNVGKVCDGNVCGGNVGYVKAVVAATGAGVGPYC